MSMISDEDYVLQAIRLSALRYTEDPSTTRVISLDPAVALNPYISASGLADIDIWPEITRAIDSPEPDFGDSSDDGAGARRGLRYTQTIMGNKSGGAGMRVTGRRTTERSGRLRKDKKATSPTSPTDATPVNKLAEDGFFSRPRADSAPQPWLEPPSAIGSVIASGRGMGGLDDSGLLEHAVSYTEETTEDGSLQARQMPSLGDDGMSPVIGESAGAALLGEADDEVEDQEGNTVEERLKSQRSSYIGAPLTFMAVQISTPPRASALTSALNKHIPHLVSTATAHTSAAVINPFASLYASVAAYGNNPSLSLKIYFPHSDDPRLAVSVQVRKDASVEEVTGYGLYKYWEDGRSPELDESDDEKKLSTIGWGLRIVEDNGEVDEDFPPLDRDGQILRFSYGEFAVVEATESQSRQNAAKAPHIVRRPSRVITTQASKKASEASRPKFNAKASDVSVNSFSSSDVAHSPVMQGSIGFASALSRPVLLRVRVAAGADVHFTTTISVPSDMYIADLTEVLVTKKRLPLLSSDWALCLADFTLALPSDRTVSSLGDKTDLALVKKQWAVEHGLRIGDRRGGDPSSSIFKRMSEPAAASKFGLGFTDLSQTYKKYTVLRKMPIGRHERVLAIDGDYIHIMPSESRTFFDSTKTTSFHISLVASCKLTGRAGGFKINVWRDAGQKRYEFDADNGKQAAEIIALIRALMKQHLADGARPR